jgi:hypothetical protein
MGTEDFRRKPTATLGSDAKGMAYLVDSGEEATN